MKEKLLSIRTGGLGRHGGTAHLAARDVLDSPFVWQREIFFIC
jgi:hypothetical protein